MAIYSAQHIPAPKAQAPGPRGRARRWLLGLGVVVLGLGLAGVWGYWRIFGKYPPREMMQDIKAGVAVRDIKDADQRFAQYLERRYGAMNQFTNREAAFLDFFNPEHIRALQFMVAHSPEEQRLANITASAKWVAQFRASLTPAERAQLRAKLTTSAGHQQLRQATAQYNAQDVYYRGATAPVIAQLLETIHAVQKP